VINSGFEMDFRLEIEREKDLKMEKQKETNWG
jgi:hypothetical protein